MRCILLFFFFFQAEDGIRDYKVTGVQTCALPISVGGAELYVDANALKHGGGQYSYCIQISVIQKVSLSTKPAHETLAATWSTSVMGVVGSASAATKIRGEVGAETERFVSSYFSADPPVET